MKGIAIVKKSPPNRAKKDALNVVKTSRVTKKTKEPTVGTKETVKKPLPKSKDATSGSKEVEVVKKTSSKSKDTTSGSKEVEVVKKTSSSSAKKTRYGGNR